MVVECVDTQRADMHLVGGRGLLAIEEHYVCSQSLVGTVAKFTDRTIARALVQTHSLDDALLGVFFGMSNVLFSGLVCYIWVALATTIPHWGHDWQYAGDGLRIFVSQIALLAQPALTPILIGLWLAVLGGALIGISIYRSDCHSSASLRASSER